MTLLEGKPIAEAIRAQVKSDVEALAGAGREGEAGGRARRREPRREVLCGRAAEGVRGSRHRVSACSSCPAEITQEELAAAIQALNADAAVHGIILLMPVPKGVNPQALQAMI